MTDDVRDRLEALADTAPPEVDEHFAQQLEARLRVLVASGAPTEIPTRPLWQPILALASVAVIVAAGAWFVVSADRNGGIEVVMSAATSTEVELPDGTTTDGAPGLVLPDGTRIRVGADGTAVIDGVVLDGGTLAVVRDGRLELFPDEPFDQSPTTSTSASPPTAPPTTASSSTTATPAPTTEAPIADRPTSTTSGSDTKPPSTTTTDAPTTTGLTRPDIVLDAAPIGDRRVRLEWSVRNGGGVVGWEIVARAGDRRRTMAVLRNPETRELEVERTDAPSITYTVVALGDDGAVLAESNPVEITDG